MTRSTLTSILLFVLLGTTLVETSCESPIKGYFEKIYNPQIYLNSGYDLSKPDTIIKLPATLNEISGLSYLDESHLATVQDEKGKMYIINSKDGSISHEVKFGKKGDFEGIAIVDKTVHVIKSNGRIYRFELDFENNEVESGDISTPLTSVNDVEGLTYDETTNRLLIACKGKGEVEGNEAKGKCIYAYDLHTSKFIEKELYSIKKKEIEKVILRDYPDMKLKSSFGPSAIAIHPITHKTYILGHVGKAVIVLDKEGEIEKFYPLNPSIFQQPEGICFSPGGDLFISNEGAGKRPNLMKFSYRP